ncbi:MAG: hypothetical protein Q8O56_07135 [Solirubrobacteraceae bacterium]|nr:hypothetical protein [Solirubrobacteraceae bacterium]
MSTRTALVLTLAAAIVLTAPLASARTGDNIREGVRNPSSGAATNETQIIVRSGRDNYGTRQSNLGAGGGAIYGCRSALDTAGIGNPKLSTPCLRVNNLRAGKAFDFQTNTGRVIGTMQAGSSLNTPRPEVAPFITNATGVAVGLNADRVDGLNASEIVAAAAAAVAGGGAGTGACPEGTTLTGGSCIENAPRAAATYAAAAAACGEAGRRLAPPDVLLHARTLEPINLGGGEMSADITVDSISLLGLGGVTQGYVTVSAAGALGTQELGTARAYRCITR